MYVCMYNIFFDRYISQTAGIDKKDLKVLISLRVLLELYFERKKIYDKKVSSIKEKKVNE